MVTGASAGGAIISLVLAALDGADRTTDGYVNTLFLGGLGGLAAAAIVAWALARGVHNVFRRAMVAMVALGGAAFVGALTMIAHAAAGRTGLFVLSGLCVAALAVSYRRALAR